MKYAVFKRRWWSRDKSAPGGYTPDPGIKRYLSGRVFDDEKDAREFCRAANAQIVGPNKSGIKYEFEGV